MTRKEAAKRLKKLVEVYKRYLVMTDDTQLGKVKQWTRYSVVQYLCSFSKLDPDEIAAALIREGIEVRFDDSSISAADNAKHQRRVMRIVRAMERRSEDNREGGEEKMKFKIHVPNITDREIIGSPEEAIEAFEEALWEAHLLPDDESLTAVDMGLMGGASLAGLLEVQGFLRYGEAYMEVVREEA